MSRYAELIPEDGRKPLRAPGPFGFREVYVSGFFLGDQPVRRAEVRRAIEDAKCNLLVSAEFGRWWSRHASLDKSVLPELGRPRLRWRRATHMHGEAPLYVLTVVVYPKGALP